MMTPKEAPKEGSSFSQRTHILGSSHGSPALGREHLLEEQGEVHKKTLLDPSQNSLPSQALTQQWGACAHNTGPRLPAKAQQKGSQISNPRGLLGEHIPDWCQGISRTLKAPPQAFDEKEPGHMLHRRRHKNLV